MLRTFSMIFVVLTGLCSFSYTSNFHINDINHKLNAHQKQILTAIMQKAIHFHRHHMNLPYSLTYNLRIAPQTYCEKHYSMLRGNHFSGIYDPRKNEAIVKEGHNSFRTVIHEASHYLMHTGYRYPPAWIDEGLAEYYETAFIHPDGNIYVRRQEPYYRKLQNWLKHDTIPPIASFFVWGQRYWRSLDMHADVKSRTLSWAMVYFMMHTPTGKKLLSSLIKTLSTNPKSNLILHIQGHYPGGFSAFQHDFLNFLHKMPKIQKL